MNYEYLKYFIEACKSRSLQSAANNLFISSQGLGKGINKLESYIGTDLLERSSTGVKPTAFGARFYEQACVVQKEMDRLEQMAKEYVQNMQDEKIVNITFGVIGKSKHVNDIIIAAKHYNKENPHQKVAITLKNFNEGYELLEELRDGRIDMGMLFHQNYYPDIEYFTFSDPSRLVLLTCKDTSAQEADFVTLEQMKDLPFVSAGENDPITKFVHDLCLGAGYEPNNIFYTTENNYIGSLIDSSSASILLRENYVKVISEFTANAKILPVEPEIKIADSVIVASSANNNEVIDFARYYAQWLRQIFNK